MRIGVIMGGTSRERPVSLTSGTAVYEALKKCELNVVPLDVKGDPRVPLKKGKPDVCFIALHGTGGEDGKIQALLESMKIPYTGADVKASQLAFNKWKSKEIFAKNDIPTPRAVLLTRKNFRSKLKEIRFPVFIKPLEEGSSIGVRLLNDRRTVADEIADGFKTYDKLIMEDKIFGREITIGILGKTPLPIIELTTERAFFDYEAKYKKGLTKYFADLHMAPADYKRYQQLALKVFNVLTIRDFGRVDMMLDTQGNPYVLELNSIPGMTGTSLLPKAAEKIGIDFKQLCVKILEFAVERSAT
jgi:D-alanine-D-alanine ligase